MKHKQAIQAWGTLTHQWLRKLVEELPQLYPSHSGHKYDLTAGIFTTEVHSQRPLSAHHLQRIVMASLLNQDFASESEDDDFNPAPAQDSDNEVASDEDVTSSKEHRSVPRSPTSKIHGPKTNGASKGKSLGDTNGGDRSVADEEDDEEDEDGKDGEEDEEDEDEDEDEEEAITVRSKKLVHSFGS